MSLLFIANARISCVKHLNPRQGITTHRNPLARHSHSSPYRVKHLNPRQGITTEGEAAAARERDLNV